jgi:uncharacterized protein YyaL (SSP411 family)
MPQMLVALDYSLTKPRQIVIAGKIAVAGIDDAGQPGSSTPATTHETRALLREVHRHFMPTKILILADGGDAQKYLGEKNKAIRAMSPINGKPAAYVCENFTCKAPVTDAKKLRALLLPR